MIRKITTGKVLPGSVPFCMKNKKTENTDVFESSMQPIVGLYVMFFQPLTILTWFIFKTLHFSSNYPAGNLHLSPKIYMNLHFSLTTLQNSKRFFNFICTAIKKGENKWIKPENFFAIQREDLKYLQCKCSH